MKKQTYMTRKDCKTSMSMGFVTMAVACMYVMYVQENREIPFIHSYVPRNVLPLVYLLGVGLFILGLCATIRASRRLKAIDAQKLNAQNQTGKKNKNAKNSAAYSGNSGTGYAYYTCVHCGKKLRINGGKGRIEITCPICGKKFIVNR